MRFSSHVVRPTGRTPRPAFLPGTDYNIWVVQGRNATVAAARIIHAAKSALPKNRACTPGTLEDIRARVSELGRFHRVLVMPGPADSEHKKLPVVVDISEKAPAPPKAQEPRRYTK